LDAEVGRLERVVTICNWLRALGRPRLNHSELGDQVKSRQLLDHLLCRALPTTSLVVLDRCCMALSAQRCARIRH
jgi:hypothetical protein